MKTPSKTEIEMRNEEAPWPKTIEELKEYIESLTNMNHDYGTCVYAMSLSAMAAFHYVASKEGCTGFQASCADLDFIRRSRSIKGPFMLVDVCDDLYEEGRTLTKVKEYIAESRSWLSMEATKELRKGGHMCVSVFSRMLSLAALPILPKAKESNTDFDMASVAELNLWSDKLDFLRLLESQPGHYPSMDFVVSNLEDYRRFGFKYAWIAPADISLFDSCECGGMFRCGKSVGLQFNRDLDGFKVTWSFDCEDSSANGSPGLKIKVSELEALASKAQPVVAQAIRDYLADVSKSVELNANCAATGSQTKDKP